MSSAKILPFPLRLRQTEAPAELDVLRTLRASLKDAQPVDVPELVAPAANQDVMQEIEVQITGAAVDLVLRVVLRAK